MTVHILQYQKNKAKSEKLNALVEDLLKADTSVLVVLTEIEKEKLIGDLQELGIVTGKLTIQDYVEGIDYFDFLEVHLQHRLDVGACSFDYILLDDGVFVPSKEPNRIACNLKFLNGVSTISGAVILANFKKSSPGLAEALKMPEVITGEVASID